MAEHGQNEAVGIRAGSHPHSHTGHGVGSQALENPAGVQGDHSHHIHPEIRQKQWFHENFATNYNKETLDIDHIKREHSAISQAVS